MADMNQDLVKILSAIVGSGLQGGQGAGGASQRQPAQRKTMDIQPGDIGYENYYKDPFDETMLSPMQANALKTAKKIQKDQMTEAAQQGVPLEQMLEQVGIPKEALQPQQQQQNSGDVMRDLLNSVEFREASAFDPGGQISQENGKIVITTPGRMARAAGVADKSGLDMLGDLVKMFDQSDNGMSISNRIDLLKEDRMRKQEDRRLKQVEIANIKDTGITLSEDEIGQESERLSRDFSSIVEAYGIPATQGKDGKRSYNIPPQKELERRIGARTFAPAEVEHLNDIDVVGNDMATIIGDLKALGVSPQDGANIFSDLGKLSLPARSEIIAQYAKGPKYNDIKRRLERVFQRYRKIITGAQASDRELKTIRPLITSFTDNPEVFFETADSLVQETRRQFNNRLDLYQAAGRDVTKMRELLSNRIEKDKSRAGVNTYLDDRPTIDSQIQELKDQAQSIKAELGVM